VRGGSGIQRSESSDRDDYGVNANCSRTAGCFWTLAVTPSTPPALTGFGWLGVGAAAGACVVVVPVVASVVVGLGDGVADVVVEGGTVVV